jgi:hypothetical protein
MESTQSVSMQEWSVQEQQGQMEVSFLLELLLFTTTPSMRWGIHVRRDSISAHSTK